MRRLNNLVFLLCSLFLAGCGGRLEPVGTNPASGVTKLEELPAPTGVDVQQGARASFVGPFTELSIEVFGITDLSREILTDGEGDFAFPLIGVVKAAGRTPTEIAHEIEDRLRGRFVKNPSVTANFKASESPLLLQSQAVAVDGEVTRAGQYPVVGKVTLMRAVALAGGLTEFAKKDDVLIFRKVGGQQYVGLYNLGAIRRGNYADPEVYPNDVVIVGDSPARRRFQDILQASPLLTTPLIILGNTLSNN